MYFAAGYRHQIGGDSFSSLVLPYPEVKEVYFPWVDEPSGRPPMGLVEEDDPQTVKDILREELTLLRGAGRRLDLLLNANCYGARAMSRELEHHLIDLLRELEDWGCRPETVTTASPFVATVVRQYFPGIEIRASVNMRLTTLQAMEYLSPWFDSYYIGRDVQRNLDTVRKMSGWAHSHGKTIGLLANSGCLRDCPWQTYHDNLIAHSAEASRLRSVPGFNPHLCWTLYRDPSRFPELLKATWIRPEDLHLYAPYVDFVKLATRQHAMPSLVIDSYVRERFCGNLTDLLEPGFTPAFAKFGVGLDNTCFPSDWAARSGSCTRECTGCGYCEQVYDMIKQS